MNHSTHRYLVNSAHRHIDFLKQECEIHKANLPDAHAQRLLHVAQEHIAEHQKDLEALKNAKVVSDELDSLIEESINDAQAT